MSCPHTPHPSYTINENNPEHVKRITEGCCPNYCGPMVRLNPTRAKCPCCELNWHSNRIPSIWPTEVKGS